MHIEFRSMGGIAFFPGLNKPVQIDVEALPTKEASRLRGLIEDTHFYDLPKNVGNVPRGAADYKHYVITIEEGEKCHSVTIFEPIDEPRLRALVEYLKQSSNVSK